RCRCVIAASTHRTESGSSRLPAIQEKRHGSIVDERDLHHRAKDSGGDLKSGGQEQVCKPLVEALGKGGLGGGGETGAATGPAIGQQCELADHKDPTSDVQHAPVHLALIVLEGAKVK